MVSTGIEVDTKPVPIPDMITVAGPVSALAAIVFVGLNE